MCHSTLSDVDVCYFFFQAEDGIRDYDVTGVQTCALPIYTGTDPVEIKRLIDEIKVLKASEYIPRISDPS